ncbi:hypothetical protein ACOQFV_23035 [Nocardiopsis changdeensis]|uniref:DUF1772 domain-containing protein n=1 Tax=Nocardiopsis changdeensis TaxID=2831969 RepID=A0ABX8BIK8_9ACTN|nr:MULTISPECIES: hypothetical protein [Nocardiopsis]QUX21941.1 hypothetical protein KGD84_26830 [Nocardiopsis changdeensis]QYX37877.1 hypothetical protein K1J57_04225 [Nocardiopsis sp. MT53]
MYVLAAVMQLLIAAAFVSIPLVRHRFGARATAAAEAELARQGVRGGVLADNGMRFDAGGHETAAPVSVAVLMVALAALNLAGAPWAQPVGLVLMPLVLVGNGLIVWSNLTAASSVRTAFERKGDPELLRIDVPAFLKAAEDAFPSWVRLQQWIRNTVVFGGGATALVATALA